VIVSGTRDDVPIRSSLLGYAAAADD
jgi:hypothetical protein